MDKTTNVLKLTSENARFVLLVLFDTDNANMCSKNFGNSIIKINILD